MNDRTKDETAPPEEPKAPEPATDVSVRMLVVSTDGTHVNILKQEMSNLALLTIGNLLVSEAQARMGLRPHP